MLFDCQLYLAKNVHNGALPVHENHNRDMLLHVDGETELVMWKGNMFMA